MVARLVWEVVARLVWDLIFHYCPRLVWKGLARLVWEVLARLVWDLIILVLSQTRYFFSFITYLTDLGPHIFTIAPD